MNGPYREQLTAGNAARAGDPEARLIYTLLTALGGLRLVVALVLAEAFGAEVTVAIALAVLGLVGVLRTAR